MQYKLIEKIPRLYINKLRHKPMEFGEADYQILGFQLSSMPPIIPPSFPEQMQAQIPPMGPRPVLPQVHRLPGAELESPLLEGQTQAGGGEGGADVGRHVVGPFVGVDPGPGFPQPADRAHPLPGHEGLQVGG